MKSRVCTEVIEDASLAHFSSLADRRIHWRTLTHVMKKLIPPNFLSDCFQFEIVHLWHSAWNGMDITEEAERKEARKKGKQNSETDRKRMKWMCEIKKIATCLYREDYWEYRSDVLHWRVLRMAAHREGMEVTTCRREQTELTIRGVDNSGNITDRTCLRETAPMDTMTTAENNIWFA